MYLTESVTESVNLPPYDLSYSTGEGEKDVAMLPALRAADGVEKVWFASCDNGDYVLDRNEFASGYRNILEKTGASSATISRVNRSLSYGTGAYEKIFARYKKRDK